MTKLPEQEELENSLWEDRATECIPLVVSHAVQKYYECLKTKKSRHFSRCYVQNLMNATGSCLKCRWYYICDTGIGGIK